MTLERVQGELVILLQEIEKYVQEDPYVLNGLVLSWYVSKICLESAGMHGVLTRFVPRLCCLPGTTFMFEVYRTIHMHPSIIYCALCTTTVS
jgi:hypothetical protein